MLRSPPPCRKARQEGKAGSIGARPNGAVPSGAGCAPSAMKTPGLIGQGLRANARATPSAWPSGLSAFRPPFPPWCRAGQGAMLWVVPLPITGTNPTGTSKTRGKIL